MNAIPFVLGDDARAERDGCGCPPWVIRCAHFDGRWVAFHEVPEPARGWAVCSGFEPAEYLDYAEGHKGSFADTRFYKDDALEAFYAAEAELLGRSEA